MGTAAGQFIIAYTSTHWGWQEGYLLIIAIDISLTLIPILRIVYDEFKELKMIKTSVLAMGLQSRSMRD
jgi:sugar phosphate permease